MSIGVQSFPELFTTILGFHLYDVFWDLLTQTGIAYLPFVGLIYRNVSKHYEMQGALAAGASLRSMEVQLVATLFMILLAGAPALTLDLKSVSYSPVCNQDGKTFFAGDTNTRYDKAFSLPKENVRVPIVWYGVIAVAEGITTSANQAVGCVPDLRKMLTEVNVTQINDPALKQEIMDFNDMCYVPAKQKMLQDTQTPSDHAEIVKQKMKENGVEDVDWLGSRTLSETYYKNLKSTRTINGAPYNANEDLNAGVNPNAPQAGMPNCYDWWRDENYGLRKRIYAKLPNDFASEFQSFLNVQSDKDKTQDDMVRNILGHTENSSEVVGGLFSEFGYAHASEALGTFFHQFEAYPKIYMVMQAAPIIQSLFLLLIYVFLPFMLVFTGYRFSSMIKMAFLIFSLIFWAFIWHLVVWTDHALMNALYDNWFSRQGATATLSDLLMCFMIVLAPLFWFSLLNAVGTLPDAITGSANQLNQFNNVSAGSKGVANAASKTASEAASLIEEGATLL